MQVTTREPRLDESFGNPYILSSFPELKTYIVAYGDMSSLQRAAARSILGQQGIVVARRTVAKYREALNIPPVNLRKSI